jgi:hypothetical protein
VSADARPILHIDVESRSTANLPKTGAPAYWQHPTTDVILASFCKDDEPMQRWRRGYPVPALIVQAIAEGWLIYAHNAGFEWWAWICCLGPRYGWPVPDPRNLRCTAAMAAAMALPRSLDGAASALGLKHQKDGSGYRLMMQMCRPRSIKDGVITWWEDEDKMLRLAAYCDDDVEAERELGLRVRVLSDIEQELWFLDREMNDTGVHIDIPMIKAARLLAAEAIDELNAELRKLTGGRVKSVTAASDLAMWLDERGVDLEMEDKKATRAARDAEEARVAAGPDIERQEIAPVMRLSVDKLRIKNALKVTHEPVLRRVLEIRQEAARSSVAKLTSFLEHAGPDGVVRENVMFCGAGTGRWAAKGVQLHNLVRPMLDYAVVRGALAVMQLPDAMKRLRLLGSPIDLIAQCMRSMIIAGPGEELVFGDYANIEGRVLAWLAGEEWKLQAFRDYDAGTGPNLYLLAASKMFGIDLATLTKDSPEYQPGKVGELAFGFGGGVGAYQAMAAAYGVEIADELAEELKLAWRDEHRNVVRFWHELEDAAMQAVRYQGAPVWAGEIQRGENPRRAGKIGFLSRQGVLWMQLPSGRRLSYIQPAIREKTMPWKDAQGNDVVRDVVMFMGQNPVTKRWEAQAAYGGLWAENATQATARDVMARAMVRMKERGWRLLLTVHDEIIAKAKIGALLLEEFLAEMTRDQDWFAGLPLTATGHAGPRYRK